MKQMSMTVFPALAWNTMRGSQNMIPVQDAPATYKQLANPRGLQQRTGYAFVGLMFAAGAMGGWRT